MAHRDDNERRVARMDVWIDLADRTETTEDRAHLRFVLCWTAYEAAYQVYEPSGNSPDKKKRKAFHLRAPFPSFVSWSWWELVTCSRSSSARWVTDSQFPREHLPIQDRPQPRLSAWRPWTRHHR